MTNMIKLLTRSIIQRLFRAVPRSLRSSGTGVKFRAIPRRVFKWSTATRLRKVLSSILAILIVLTSIRFIFLKPKEVRAADIYLGFNEGYGSTTADTNSTITASSITNAVWKTEELCKTGKCFYFDGTGDYISHADDANLDMAAANAVTIELWFRTPDITSGTRTLVAKEEATGADGGYRIQMNSSGQVVFGIDNDNSGYPAYSVTSTNAYDDNKWHHISAVKDGTSSMTLYIDAIPVGTTTIASTDASNDDTFYVGIYNGASDGFSGFIDEVKVLRSARTATEVKADFTGETPSRGTSASFGPSDSYLSDGLVGYWKMEEAGDATRVDSSGNSNTLTESAADTIAQATGKFGYAGDFESTETEYLSIADNAVLSITGSLTLSAWIRPETVSAGTYNIVAKWDGASESYRLLQNGDEIRIEIDSSGNYVETTVSNLATATWYHVVGVYDSSNSTARVFVNGLQASSTAAGVIPSSIGDVGDVFHLGAEDSTGGATGYYDGIIDEARVYNRALSPAEVQRLYSWAPGPVGYWKFDDNTGSSAVDVSGNSNTATLNASPAWAAGKFGSALKFTSASSQYLSASDSVSLSITRDLTISTWVNPTAVTAATEFPIGGKTSSSSVISYYLSQYGDEIRLYIGSFSNYATTNAANLVAGTWYHVSATYQAAAATVTIYVNGLVQASTVTGTIPTSIADGADGIDIGHRQSGSAGTPIDITIAASADDAWYRDPGTTDFDNTYTYCSAGYNSAYNGTVMRFPGITGLSGATITASYFSYYCTAMTGTPPTYIYAEDAASPTQTTSNSDVFSRTSTSNTVSYSTSTCNEYVYNNSPSLNTIIQELATSYNPTAIQLFWYGNATPAGDNLFQFTCYDLGPGTSPPKLHIEYTTLANYYYGGTIDDFKIYNYARNLAQVAEDMNAGHPAPGSPVGSATAWWKFDEGYSTTANDSGTSDADLTLSAATAWTNSGKFGKAFDGADNRRVAGTDDADLEPGASEDFSISAWFKSDGATTAATEYLVSKGGSGAGGYQIYFNTSGQVVCGIDDDITSFPEDSATTTTDYYDTSWHHVVCVRDIATDKLYLYVDGQLVASDSDLSATGTMDTTSVFYLGDQNATDGTDEFLGDVDEVKFYRLALIADQVKIEFNQGKASVLGALGTNSTYQPQAKNQEYCVPGDTTSCAAPVGEWKMDENTGTSANDSSGNANTGTITAGTGSWIAGKYGSAYNFDGANTVVNAASGTTLDNLPASGMSLEAWIYPTSMGEGSAGIIMAKNVGTTPSAGWLLKFAGTNALTFTVDGSTDLVRTTSNNVVTLNAWNHVAIYWDGVITTASSVHIYVNGVETTYATTTNGAARVDDGTSSFYIGNDSTQAGTFTGKIDEAKAFNYARTPAQVAYDYNRGAPVAWYKFDESSWTSDCATDTVFDSSGNAYHGDSCPNGTGQTTPETGKLNNAIHFDGSNDYINLGTGLDQNGDISLSAWIKTDTIAAGWRSIVSNYDSGCSTGDYSLDINTTAAKITLNWGNVDVITSNTSLATGTWYHVVATRSGSAGSWTANLYINGVLDKTASTEFNPDGSSVGTSIGRGGACAGAYFDGVVDDVRIYNYALTATQVKTLYNENSSVRFGP